jgi:A/G-specific adenine glycosylase
MGARGSLSVERDAESLAAWFSVRQRDLPWRLPFTAAGTTAGTVAENGAPRRDPYRVWIAEIMLQQTQVATVVPYFVRWMERFPDVATLAAAAETDVLEAWAGLGYYSRARNILVTARELAARGGVFPGTREGLLALKGIGEYTAGAIASLAFDRPEPILDGNLVRVFSRFYGMAFLPDSKANKAAYWGKAKAWAEAHRPGMVNEGLMELGALICTPRNPACDECPLAQGCKARSDGTLEKLPPAKARRTGVEVEGYAVAVFRNAESGRQILLYTPGKDERLAGLATFPFFAVPDWKALKAAWRTALPGFAGAALKPRPAQVTHGITHHRYRIRVAEADVGEREAAADPPMDYFWVPEEGLERTLVSSLPRKIWSALRELPAP